MPRDWTVLGLGVLLLVVNLVGFLIVPLHHLLMDVLRRFIAHASESALLLFKTVAIHRYYPSVTFRFLPYLSQDPDSTVVSLDDNLGFAVSVHIRDEHVAKRSADSGAPQRNATPLVLVKRDEFAIREAH